VDRYIPRPLIPEVGVLALPYHHWGTCWMTPHHVLPRLAHYFHVLWLEPAHHWRSVLGRREQPKLPASIPTTFQIHVPEAVLPDVYRPAWARNALLRARVRRGWQKLAARGCRIRVLHLWHPGFEAALDGGSHDLAMYHIDDEYAFKADAPPLSEQERRVLQKVDQAFAISPALMERKGGVNPNLDFVPEGVDYQAYATPKDIPKDLAHIPRPIVGYTGNIKRQLDWPLLDELTLRHPEWSFVFVGPRSLLPEQEAIALKMASRSNVHFLGAKTAIDLAAYPQHFDVCIMPYVVDGYTNNIYPLKLHEYLASGRQVIGTPVRSLLDFSHVIRLARGVDEWSGALAQMVTAPFSGAAAARRQAIAREHDWTELIYRIAAMTCRRLGPEFEPRVQKIGAFA
jgi:hypothetical protein